MRSSRDCTGTAPPFSNRMTAIPTGVSRGSSTQRAARSSSGKPGRLRTLELPFHFLLNELEIPMRRGCLGLLGALALFLTSSALALPLKYNEGTDYVR